MSTTIDQKVVEMRFDNRQFESNVATTMSTLEKLKQKLNLSGAAKSMESVGTAAKKVDLSGIGVAAETVGLKFNAMYTMADQALRNLVNSAMNATSRIAKALTIEPIMTGFSEYETQINAIQTILANTESKGTTLNDVNNALDTLNTYADKTIYNFTEMTKNIGTFTAAGIDLDTSVTAIQGIANLAAISGSTSQQASTAMYQLSQALASGTVKLMDWNSVVNAGMGGQVFQDALKETARVHGVAIDSMINEQGSFRETLQEGWLTSQILTETLAKFTMTTEGLTEAEVQRNKEMLKTQGYTDAQIDSIFKLGKTATNAATKVKTLTQLWDTLKEAAQSGWTQTWELIVGDFEESKELFTGVSDAIGAMLGESADARNSMLDGALTNNWDRLVKKINEAGIETTDFENRVKNVAKDQKIDIDGLINKYGSLENVFRKGAISSDILKQAVNGIGKSVKDVNQTVVDLSKVTGKVGIGMRGEDVKQIEDALKSLGYTLTGKDGTDYSGDGYFGTLTRDAIKAFQKAQGLKITGIVDESTLAALKEATTKTNELSESVDGVTINVDDLIAGVTELGGRELLIEAFKNVFNGLASIIKPIGEAFREVFPPTTSEQLYNFIAGFKKLTDNFKLSDTAIKNLKNTFKGLFSIFDILGKAIIAVGKAILPLFGGLGSVGSNILSVTGNFGEWLTKLNETIEKTDVFSAAIQWVATNIKKSADAVKNFIKNNDTINKVFDKIAVSINSFINSIKNYLTLFKTELIANGGIVGITKSAIGAIGGFLSSISEVFSKISIDTNKLKIDILGSAKSIGSAFVNSGFVKGLESLLDGVVTIGGKIIKGLGTLAVGIINAVANIDFSNVLDIANTASLGAIAVGIYNFFKKISNPLDEFSDGLSGMFKGVTGILDGVKGSLQAYQNSLNAGALMDIAKAVGVLAAAVLVMSLIDSSKLSESVGAITMLFVDLSASMAVMNKFGGGLNTGAIQMVAISSAVLILASACKSISSLNWDELVRGLTGVSTIILAISLLNNYGNLSANTIKSSLALVVLGGALHVMASACKSFGSVDTETLVKGVASIGVILLALGKFNNLSASNTKDIIYVSAAITAIGASMRVFAKACKMFGEIDLVKLAKGLVSIIVLLQSLGALVSKLSDTSLKLGSMAVGFVGIAASMLIFASACEKFGEIDTVSLVKGLTSTGIILLEVAALAKIAGSASGSMASVGVGMVGVAAAMIVLSGALDIMGGMDIGEIAKGLIAMGGSIAIIAVGLKAMTGTLAGSAAMVVAAGALALLTPVIGLLGSMSLGTIVTGLIAIAGAFAVFGVAAKLLGPVIPSLLGLAGAFALVGAGALGLGAAISLAGVGFGAFITGLLALSAAGAGAATAIMASLSIIVIGIAELIPIVVTKLGEGIIAFCKVIGDSATTIGQAIKEVILAALDVLVECVPSIVDSALVLITEVLNSLGEYAPQIVESLFNFITGILQSIAARIPELITTAVNYFAAFFTGIVDALKGLGTETLVTSIVGIGLLAGIMAALGAVVSLIPGAMVGVLGMGAVIAELAIVLAAIGALAQIPGLDWLINEGGALLENIGNAIGSLVGGIVGGVVSGVTGQFPQIGTDLSNFMTNVQPFIDGAKTIDASVLDGVSTLASVVMELTKAELLSGITSFITGGSSLSSFGADLAEFGPSMKSFADSISGLDTELVTNAANAAKALSEMATNLPNSGGIAAIFSGDNTLSSFAAELATFGPSLKSYSDSIKGLDANVVTDSANAASALAELATNLPNSGGIAAVFTGDNTLSAFAKELEAFGPSLKAYASSVSGLDANVVTNSTNAAKALAELATNLPNTGGIISLFTGDNSLSSFGDEIVAFGEDLASYGSSISGIDANVVTATTNAASALVTLQESLPEDGGWFSSEVTLKDFGKELNDFGTEFGKFYTSISAVDTTTLTSTVTEIGNIKDLISGMATLDTSGVETFKTALKDLGKAGIDGFTTAFTDASTTINTTATDMMNKFVEGLNSKKTDVNTAFSNIITAIKKSLIDKYKEFNECGSTAMTKFIAGIKSQDSNVNITTTNIITGCLTVIESKYLDFNTVGMTCLTNMINGINSQTSNVKLAITNLINACLTVIKNKYSEFKTAGATCITKLAEGATSKKETAVSKFGSVASSALKAVKEYKDDFYDAGGDLVDGFASGISENAWKAEAKAAAMAKAALNAAKSELDINSPSKEFFKVGNFAGLGFVNALATYVSKADAAGAEIGRASLDGMVEIISKVADVLDSGIDINPTIRPTLDLSNVEANASKLNALFSRNRAVSINAGMNDRTSTSEIQNGTKTATAGNVYQFTQNNYSPKALSRIEIYRQTKNQFSSLKGLVPS